MKYETQTLCSALDRWPTASFTQRPSLPQCLHRTPLPDPPAIRRGPASVSNRPKLGLYAPHGASCHPRFRPRTPRLSQAEVLPTPLGPSLPRRPLCRTAQRFVAPQSPAVRQAHQPLDFGPFGRRLPRQRLDAPPPECRGHPLGRQAPGHPLEKSQALDQQPRPGLRAKKKARDRLIRLAQSHPDWVLAYQDETWWSRLAVPNLHAWTPDEPWRLVQSEKAKDD